MDVHKLFVTSQYNISDDILMLINLPIIYLELTNGLPITVVSVTTHNHDYFNNNNSIDSMNPSQNIIIDKYFSSSTNYYNYSYLYDPNNIDATPLKTSTTIDYCNNKLTSVEHLSKINHLYLSFPLSGKYIHLFANLKYLKLMIKYTGNNNFTSSLTHLYLLNSSMIVTIPITIKHLTIEMAPNIRNTFYELNLNILLHSFAFNENLKILPNSIKILKFGNDINYSCNNLPHNLYFLNVGDNFNGSVDNLPNNLKYLLLGKIFDKKLDYLPNNLKCLILSNYCKNKIFNLPSSLNYFLLSYILNTDNKKYKIILPNFITHLIFDNCAFDYQQFYDYYYPILCINYPNSLKYLISESSNKFDQNLQISNTHVEYLSLNESFNKIINYSLTLKYLLFGNNFNQNINNLPHGLIYLKLGLNFKQNTDNLPTTIKYLIIHCNYTYLIWHFLPCSIIYIKIDNRYMLHNTTEYYLPNSVQCLKLIGNMLIIYEPTLNHLIIIKNINYELKFLKKLTTNYITTSNKIKLNKKYPNLITDINLQIHNQDCDDYNYHNNYINAETFNYCKNHKYFVHCDNIEFNCNTGYIKEYPYDNSSNNYIYSFDLSDNESIDSTISFGIDIQDY